MTIYSGETSAAFSLCENFLSGQEFEIDADQYATLSQALTTVVSAKEIEDLFQVFAQSFLRFEKDLLDMAFQYTYIYIFDLNNEAFFSNIRHRFNVNIITILTAYRSYDDHCDRILKSSINLTKTKEFNCKTRSKTFDTHLSYRICDQLRNYAQHRALPMGGFSIGGKTNFVHDTVGSFRKSDAGFNVSPWLNALDFKSSSQCKAALRKELEHLGYEKIDLKWLIRSFVCAMYERHAALRAFLKPQIITAGEKIAAGYDLASAAKNSEAKYLELRGKDAKRPMRNDLGAMVLGSFETYTSFTALERSYVTSQIIPEATTYSGQVDS